MNCPKCGADTFKYKEKGPHVGEYCARCRQWIRWVPKKGNKALLKSNHQMSDDKFDYEKALEYAEMQRDYLADLEAERQLEECNEE